MVVVKSSRVKSAQLGACGRGRSLVGRPALCGRLRAGVRLRLRLRLRVSKMSRWVKQRDKYMR